MTTFSFIVPVLNEADAINPLIGHIRSLERAGEGEVIVVDGSSSGDTVRAVADAGIRRLSSGRGRALQMNVGAAAAKGRYLIFLHADTRLPRRALTLIEEAMTAGDIAGGAFDLRIDSPRLSLRLISRVASLRSRLTRIPYGDQAIFIRKEAFDRIGGYPSIPLMEDVALMRNLKKAGRRIFIIPEPAATSPRRWEAEGIVYTTLRNWSLIMAYFLGASPEKLARYYRHGRTLYGIRRKESNR
jgi:rSAM/selenodomain-associated transferase 2